MTEHKGEEPTLERRLASKREWNHRRAADFDVISSYRDYYEEEEEEEVDEELEGADEVFELEGARGLFLAQRRHQQNYSHWGASASGGYGNDDECLRRVDSKLELDEHHSPTLSPADACTCCVPCDGVCCERKRAAAVAALGRGGTRARARRALELGAGGGGAEFMGEGGRSRTRGASDGSEIANIATGALAAAAAYYVVAVLLMPVV